MSPPGEAAGRPEPVAAEREAAPEETLPVHVKAVFALGDHTVNIQLTTVSLFFLFFLTEVAGLPPSWAGLVLLAGRAVDAVTDPLMGTVSDRTRWRAGRRRPFFLLGALPFGISFALLWSESGLPTESAVFLYYVAVYGLNTLSSTVLAVPYMALMPELARGYHERTSLNSYRAVGVAAALFVAALGMPALVERFGGGARGYAGAGVVLGVWVAIPWLAVWAVTWERPQAVAADGGRLRDGFRRLLRHRSYRVLVALFLAARIAVDVCGALLIFFFTYWLRRPDDFPLALALLLVGVVVSLPFWLRMGRRHDKRTLFIAGALAWSVTLVGLFLADPDDPRAWVLALAGLSGIGYAVADLMPWSMLGEVIDEDELGDAGRRDGTYTGVFTFLRKLGGAAGVALAGFALEAAGFARGEAEQPEAARQAIRTLTTLGPVAFLLLAAAIALRYPLTRARHREVLAHLAARDERASRP